MNQETLHYQLEFEQSSNVQARIETEHGVLEATEHLDFSVGDFGENVVLSANPNWEGAGSASMEMSNEEAKLLAQTLLRAAGFGTEPEESE